MANKKSKKKAKKQGAKPAQAAAQAETPKGSESPAGQAKASQKREKAPAKQAKAAKPAQKQAKKAKAKDAKPGAIARARKYLGSIASEMRHVTWPTKQELVNYSIAVCASLVVVGIVIAVLDFGISEALVLFSGLRG